MANPNEDEELDSELDDEDNEEDPSVVDSLTEFAKEDLPGEIERIKELVGVSVDKLALSEIAETVIPMIVDLALMVAELAEEQEELGETVFGNPTRSVLLPADGRLIVSALHHAYEWAKIVKNERAEKQDRVHEALEVVTELRVAYERALELVIDGEDVPPADPLQAVRDIAGAKVTTPVEEPPSE